MRIPRYQRLVLENYLSLQNREPSYRRAVTALIPYWILVAVLCGAGWTIAASVLQVGGLAYAFPGLFVGVVAAQLGNVRQFVLLWPLQKQILDAERVRALLAEDDAAAERGEVAPLMEGGRAPNWRKATVIGLCVAVLVVGGPIAYIEGMKAYHDPTKNTPGRQVKVYTAAWCGPCKMLKAHLKANSIPFQEFDVEESQSAYYAWASTRSRGVPVTVIDNQIFRGANLGKIDGALRGAGFTLVRESLPVEGGERELVSPLKR